MAKTANQSTKKAAVEKLIASSQAKVTKEEDILLAGVMKAISYDVMEADSMVSDIEEKLKAAKEREEKVRYARKATAMALGVLSRVMEDPTSELSILVAEKNALEATAKDEKILHEPELKMALTNLEKKIGKIKEMVTSYVITTFDLNPEEAWALSKSINKSSDSPVATK